MHIVHGLIWYVEYFNRYNNMVLSNTYYGLRRAAKDRVNNLGVMWETERVGRSISVPISLYR